MKIRANMHFKDKYTCDEDCIIEKVVAINADDFNYLCKHLLETNKYIKDNFDSMYIDENDKLHCLLLIDERTGNGLLVNNEDCGYARYHSYIPNARQIAILNKYPVLKNFIERMSEVAEDILSKAPAQLSEDNDKYEVDIEKYNRPGEPVINAALLDDMLMDSGMVEDSVLHEGYIELKLSRQLSENPYRKCYDSNDSTEIEIICAKHALWIYDEKGGERADFSDCLLENVNLSNCNLCAANFSGATLINCNLDNASMCDAKFENTKFDNCSFKHHTAENADFKGAVFENCNCNGAYFGGSNFTNAQLNSVSVMNADFGHCCVQAMQTKGTNLVQANTKGIMYDEMEWIDEGEGHIPAMTM